MQGRNNFTELSEIMLCKAKQRTDGKYRCSCFFLILKKFVEQTFKSILVGISSRCAISWQCHTVNSFFSLSHSPVRLLELH